MTRTQRKKINKQNAQKSTGPRTDAGKERARRNAMKHGLCASRLTLPGEDRVKFQEMHREWVDTLLPQTPAEVAMVDEAVRANIRLQRAAKVEHARLNVAAYDVFSRLAEEREEKLADFIALLAKEPALAARELQRFGHGCRWMLERWRAIETALTHGVAIPVEQIRGAGRLLGGNPKTPQCGPVRAFSFRFWHAVATQEAGKPVFLWLCKDEQAHKEHFARYGEEIPTVEQAREQLLGLVRAEIATLDARAVRFAELDYLEQERASAEAMVPEDSPKTKLWMRYEKGAGSALHRALSTLGKLQKERRAAEAEAEAEERNEANRGSGPQVSDQAATDCVAQRDADSGGGGEGSVGSAVVPQSEDAPTSLVAVPVAPVAPLLTACDGSA